MADNKKEQERDELHRAIWAIADELRGAVDGWDFKNYVLGTMFYRYISENLCNYINEGEVKAGKVDFDYAKLSDEETDLSEKEIENIVVGNPRDAKARLALEITAFYHGLEAAKAAEGHFNRVFREKEFPEDMDIVKAGLFKIFNLVDYLTGGKNISDFRS